MPQLQLFLACFRSADVQLACVRHPVLPTHQAYTANRGIGKRSTRCRHSKVRSSSPFQVISYCFFIFCNLFLIKSNPLFLRIALHFAYLFLLSAAARIPACRPKMIVSEIELPPILLLPCRPPQTSPHANSPEMTLPLLSKTCVCLSM